MTILFLDTETSGLPNKFKCSYREIDNWPRVLQVAWKLDTDDHVTSYYIYPDFEEEFSGVNIHGITRDKALQEGRPLQDVLKELDTLIQSVDIVCGHNIAYDINVLSAEYLRYNIPFILRDKVLHDTMISGTKYCGLKGGKWPRLSECYAKCCPGVEIPGEFHDAATDVLACEACYVVLAAHQEIEPITI